jgi:hypothetical protein
MCLKSNSFQNPAPDGHFKQQLEQMQKHIASMMKNLDAMVGNIKALTPALKK